MAMDKSCNENNRLHGEVDFSGLILGFCSAALTYMGYSVDGKIGSGKKNLILAKQNIDFIEILRDKTKGNLLEDEKQLIEQVLTDLRIKYIEVSKN
ncbi:MAG: DUF1844 domain-containing protein [Oligoflexales bacterium]|nr:DUF1844 domain-containing protein [Oligoflexales bacterium]